MSVLGLARVGSAVRLLGVALLAALLLLVAHPLRASAALAISQTPSSTNPYYVCPHGPCQAVIAPAPVRTSLGFARAGGALLEGSGELGGYSPADLASAYGIPRTGAKGETIAVIVAWGYPSAETELAQYRSHYKLPLCTRSNGCFKVVNQEGNLSPLPSAEGWRSLWTPEQALDLDMVSAACPQCHILLVQASSEHISDLAAAANEAAKLGAAVITNSYGFNENSSECGAAGCSQYAADYEHPGVVTVAGSGDSGYNAGYGGSGAPNFPSSATGVIAVGGTTLHRAESSRGWSETAWKGSGSGCSVVEAKPAWQSDPGCTKRTTTATAARERSTPRSSTAGARQLRRAPGRDMRASGSPATRS